MRRIIITLLVLGVPVSSWFVTLAQLGKMQQAIALPGHLPTAGSGSSPLTLLQKVLGPGLFAAEVIIFAGAALLVCSAAADIIYCCTCIDEREVLAAHDRRNGKEPAWKPRLLYFFPLPALLLAVLLFATARAGAPAAVQSHTLLTLLWGVPTAIVVSILASTLPK